MCREKRSINRIINSAYKYHKNGANRRGLNTFLTIEEYVEIASRPCVYCGDISIRENPDTGDEILLNSVDRINNEKFYTIESVQSVCFLCQRIKSDLKSKDFLNHINKIKTNSIK